MVKISFGEDVFIPTVLVPPSTNSKWLVPVPATLKSLSYKFWLKITGCPD